MDLALKGQARLDLAVACRILQNRFPYLNLKGLAKVKDLKVKARSEEFPSFIRHTYSVFHASQTEKDQPKIGIEQSYRKNKLNLANFGPDLPKGEHLGMSLLFLILTRDNRFAGAKASIIVASESLKKIVDQMEGFDPRSLWIITDRILTIPGLFPEESAAVEWYWTNILK